MEGNPSISIPFFMIASDAGYFERPIESRAFFISPGERYEIIVNFAAFRGKKLTLRNDRLAMGEPIFPATHLVMQFVVLDVDPTDMSNNDGPQASLVPFNRTPREVAVERFFGFDQ
jgi:bilirubin oxidase